MAISFANPKEYITELVGTAILVFIGCMFGTVIGTGLGVAIGFALTFVGLIYCLGKFSDCHFNPLITLSMFINGKMKADDTLWYVLAQIIGGIVGAVLCFLFLAISADTWDLLFYADYYGGYYVMYGQGGVEVMGAIIIEFLLAFLLSYVAMKATESKKIDMRSGAVIAAAIFGLVYIGSWFTNTAVNPAKSIGAAIAMLFSGIKDSAEPFLQLWVFIIFPVLGAIVGTFIYMIMESGEFDLNKYLSSVKKNKAEDAEEEYSEETAEEPSEDVAEEPVAEAPVEEPAAEEPVAEAPVEEIPEIESVEPTPGADSEEEPKKE